MKEEEKCFKCYLRPGPAQHIVMNLIF